MAIDWKAIRKEFESGGVTIIELAKKDGLHRNTIGNRIKKEFWKKRIAPEEKRRAGAQKPADLIDDHRVLWKGVKRRLVKGLRNNDVKLGLEELKVAKMAGEVLSSVIKGERLAWGIEGAVECAEMNDTDEIACKMDLATIPRGTDEAVVGE